MIIIYIVIRENENQSTEYICADRRSKYRRLFFLNLLFYRTILLRLHTNFRNITEKNERFYDILLKYRNVMNKLFRNSFNSY